MAGTVTIEGLSAGEPGGQRTLRPLSTVGLNTSGETIVMPLAAGDNTIAVTNPQAVGVVIVPPANATANLTFRTSSNASDVGLPISNAFPLHYCFPGTIPASVILNASTALSAPITLWFW